ncbi:hypothetical protein NQL31_001254 [Lotmaria passim]
MDTYDRNVAIISSAVYGGVLVIGMLLFALDRSEEPFYRHPSTNVAIFSVFWFAFSPSLLFIGATVPWACALCGSRAAALTFAVVPGGIFVLIGAYWILLNDKYQNLNHTFGVPWASSWSRNAANVRYPAAGVGAAAPGAAPYCVGDEGREGRFPSPAAIAEMMNRGSGAMYPFVPPPSGWSPGGGRGSTPNFTQLAAPSPPLAGSNWPGYAPNATAATAAHPEYRPGFFPAPTQQYNGFLATPLNYGGGNTLGEPPAYELQRRHSGSYYVA